MTHRQMPAFDRLPRDVRRVLTDLNFNWLADHVEVLVHRAGRPSA